MTSTTIVTASGTVVPISCNCLVITNDGSNEAEVIASDGTTFPVPAKKGLLVFNSDSITTDSFTVNFPNASSRDSELNIIQTTYTGTTPLSPSAPVQSVDAFSEEVHEREVIVSVLPTLDEKPLEMSYFTGGPTGGKVHIAGVPGVLLQAVQATDIAACQTKTTAVGFGSIGVGCWFQMTGASMFSLTAADRTKQFGFGSLQESGIREVKEGIFFESSTATGSVREAFKIVKFDGATSNTIYDKERSFWYDPLDGNGPSGLTANFASETATWMFWIEYIWGGNLVNIFTSINGKKILIEKAVFVGDETSAIGSLMQTPNQGFFARSHVASGSELTQLIWGGCSIYILGHQDKVGRSYSATASNGTTPVSLPLSGVQYLVLALRKKQYRCFVELGAIDFLCTSTDDYKVWIMLNPVIVTPAALVWQNMPGTLGSYSKTEYAQFNNGTPAAFAVVSFDIAIEISTNRRQFDNKEILNVLNRIGYNLSGNSDVIGIVVQILSPTLDFYGSFSVNEIC